MNPSELEKVLAEALERYPIAYAMRDLPDSDEGPDYEEYDVNKEPREAFVMGRFAGPQIRIEELIEWERTSLREVEACHAIWDKCLDMMGYGRDGTRPLFTDAVKKLVEKQPRWIPVDERLPERTEESEGKYSREVLVKVVEKGKIFHEIARMCYYIDDAPFWSCGMNNLIVAWMEIPE